MPSILVVDDEPAQRFLLCRILGRAGHQVTAASHGADALDCMYTAQPDLVVTDMTMPVTGGAELIRRLRADPATAEIPVLAVSGDAHLARSADIALAKPYTVAELVAAADALLARRRPDLVAQATMA